MSDTNPLINIGELSKPATVLIEKISDAIGGIFQPWQIRRVAQAEAEAERTRAVAQLKISELQRRALQRFMVEEAKKQINIESITAKALPNVEQSAEPQNIEDDWIANFFDKCRLISDEEMQVLWSKVLAGEANAPGTYSKRTVNFLGSLDRSDALLFQSLCRFNWGADKPISLIYDVSAEIYNRYDITFSSLKHLDEIGLLSFESFSGYRLMKLTKTNVLVYFGKTITFEFEKDNDNDLEIGKVILSKVGQELAPICGAEAIPEFYDYIMDRFKTKMKLKILYPPETESSPTPAPADERPAPPEGMLRDN
jgi:hypothetical protein